ncbi:hypothetical protein A3C09_01395 [Candidatus Uhrbacteria bacterium RIFCSPHIGHO2_02_FULL_47_44]|uniref:Uncharacterized protein n=1 Tax=Candidatus Uhrbacteria bacterium RIFCSPLOWO2_02_FULL_48_18 TaxID=1802408 RepID=A0A1F7VAH5_9BACT|nr:MAG: hypothetical protein A2839_02275 [Candidatus Uhrbacteria bacterium RIFCSPHIGHO2_01_FULL_47_10]OGL69820.1 MAG: hypothetical protein A3C09_01395 [Candidatus Uhrbacteria bacterium RIFCSPHIGHO2_02_FULL_47_44]OGL77440.1 MAG: hypothetical protein A3E97_00450 [Candidatus Uhrbacteria bacterium RIFCSPHIGHO2_12_FULL_47_12]OGL81801.1 MAG: hypothetical protein A3B20_01760 [Candidatus Uhrbacteria bacterium RIFCSPLOWO2_01_FULL_47_17]OGL86964.1 MAG: hypothetical protein A3I41_03350 [Candidatus Uhrbact
MELVVTVFMSLCVLLMAIVMPFMFIRCVIHLLRFKESRTFLNVWCILIGLVVSLIVPFAPVLAANADRHMSPLWMYTQIAIIVIIQGITLLLSGRNAMRDKEPDPEPSGYSPTDMSL